MMKILLFSLIVLLSALVSMDATQVVSAFEVSYKPNGIKLGPNPTVCTIEPTEADLSSKEIEKLMTQTRLAVDEWEAKLQRDTREHKDSWDFSYIEVNDKNRIDPDRNCDITFVFEPKPMIAEEYFVLGTADYDAETHTSLITIYYLEIEECYHSEREDDTIYYWYETCYGEDMRISNQINAVTKHEFGHAIGLAHYEPDDRDIAELWSKGAKTSPSIMVPIGFENSAQLQIRDVDIDMLYSIYGEDGFAVLGDNETEYFELFTVLDYWEQKEHDKLQKYLDEFLAKYPDDQDAIRLQASLYYELEDYEEAKPFFEKATTINPEDGDMWYSRAITLSNLEEYNDALASIEKTIEFYPDASNVYDWKGYILYNLGSYKEAIKSYNKDLSIDPDDHNTLNLKGEALFALNNYEKALANFDLSLDIEPDSTDTLFNRANALFELGEYHDAIDNYEQVLEEIPNDVESIKQLAIAYEKIGNTKESNKYDEKASIFADEDDDYVTIKEETVNAVEDESNDENNDLPVLVSQIPEWIRNNADWWASDQIDDSTFVSGIQFLIKEDMLSVDTKTNSNSPDDVLSLSNEIPVWVKNNAYWWAQGLLSDDDFLKGIQYLVEQRIIQV
ncbi:tetratricopeptide repeat protein [Nitrosopumilus sp.]|uniref:tetratricopeptide repeat protein n=1 Tax=Nitrosopumilus sp. TaxID=2024843 RepID=UPI00292E42D6|nr:tetratricopeptide repeat protein [Nitrosopumilus sp.]